jgi:hypothetical protein
MPIQSTAVTRLGIAGGIWNRLGGDYSNKETVVEGVGREAVATAFGGNQNNSASIDCGSNGNRFLVVSIVWYNDSVHTIDTITFNGVDMTLIVQQSDTNNSSLYGIVNPPTGSSTLVVNFDVAPSEGPVITAMPFYDVVQTSVAAAVRDSGGDAGGASPSSFALAGVISSDMTVAASYDFKTTPDGVTFSTLTERSEAVFEGAANFCSGAVASDLGVSTVTSESSAWSLTAGLALIYDKFIADVTGGSGGGSKKRKKRENLDELRKASKAAILRRRHAEELEAKVQAQLEIAIPAGATIEYDPQVMRIASIEDKLNRALATALAAENLALEEEERTRKRRERDQIAVLLLLN